MSKVDEGVAATDDRPGAGVSMPCGRATGSGAMEPEHCQELDTGHWGSGQTVTWAHASRRAAVQNLPAYRASQVLAPAFWKRWLAPLVEFLLVSLLGL
jgi:hypothetical protein